MYLDFIFVIRVCFPLLLPQKLDVGAELTGGCYGYAGKFMHWPEDLIVGGAQTNKTGHIVRWVAGRELVGFESILMSRPRGRGR